MSTSLTFSGDIKNDAEVKQLFLDVESGVRVQIRRALNDAGSKLVDAAKGVAPKSTGRMARSIKARLNESASSLDLKVRPSASYSYFVEFGTAPHASGSLAAALASKTKGYARSFRRSRAAAAREAGEFRTQPEPFMGPAWDSLSDQISTSLSDALARGLAEAEK